MNTGNFNDLINFVRPSEHSKYSPSAAERWLETGCPASIRLEEPIPNTSSKYAEEGTLAHSYCEAVIRQRFYNTPIPHHLSLQLAQLEDNGVEMEHCANLYADVVEWWLRNPALGKIIWWGLERGVPVFPEKGCFGTADCLVIGSEGAAVIDFKYGKGKNVSANTVQLQVYAAGVAKHLPITNKDYPITAVVHQPRIVEDAKEHTYTFQELIDFLYVIERSINKCEDPNAPIVDGNHCFWCRARRTNDPSLKCPVIADRPRKLALENFDKFLADSNLNPPDIAVKTTRDQAIIKLMALKPLIDEVVNEAHSEFKQRLINGEAIEGIQLVENYGRRVINAVNDEEASRLIKQHFPQVNPVKTVPSKVKLKTLTEIEKELGKNKLDPLCIRKITKEVKVVDQKTRSIIESMSQYAKQIGGQ